MNIDSKCKLLVHPKVDENGTYHNITSEEIGWKALNFGAKVLKAGDSWKHNTGEDEMCIVLLGGKFSLSSKWGEWVTENSRKDVFSGLPHAAYLPPNTEFTLTALSETVDFAFGYTKGENRFDGYFITPQKVNDYGIEFRGGDNASRQINSILPPGAACSKLVCVEVYTPSGNWSSFPAHKHDERKVDEEGKLLEVELEEIYFYKFNKPQGFALQKVYTDNRDLDEVAEPHNNDAVLIPKGYHPVSAGHGYHTYYLNFLAGSDQSLANTDDPDHKWIYGTWKTMDNRLPLVTLEMNNE
ncbi:MAG: 5-deoxy-glucuronate isomerase [Bacteroidetes bacterium]|nr:5-deoxy-glucuronate isomerase [Bacteroidota bacterium]MBU1116943.1 5-deoxy-glucuronate isomerase [Bacteroidota bacterium]MBU1799116.1 5-deoxy-glucuronate isomerase [Bacteroidota bacterium]